MSLGNDIGYAGLLYLNVDSVPPSQGRPTGGCTDTSGWGGFSFSFHRKVLCLDAGAGCGAAGPTEGWASLADGVALVTPVMRSAVLKNSRTVLVWPLASRWRPACQFAAATNRLTHGASSLPSSTQPPPATGARFPTIAPPASARQAPHPQPHLRVVPCEIDQDFRVASCSVAFMRRTASSARSRPRAQEAV